MAAPKLSVVLLNYNHARYLPEALGALVAQRYEPVEIIAIDDGSTDDSLEILERFAKADPRIRLLSNEKNRGIFYSVDRFLEASSGEYLYFAAADDRVLPGLFDRSMRLLAGHPEAGLCSALSGVMTGAGEYRGLVHTAVISRTECFLPPAQALATLRRHGSWILGNTSVYRKAAFIEAGGLIPELHGFCDGFTELVLALKHGVCFIPEPLAVWRKMSGSYAHTTSADLETMLDITRTAARLMRTRYRDVFPADYVEDWTRGWLFVVGTRFARASREAHVAGLGRVLSRRGVLDRAVLAALDALLAGGELVTKLYLFARLRRTHLWREMARKLRHLADPRILRLARRKGQGPQVTGERA